MDRTICERLGELRRAHGYSQEDLAEKLGLTRQAVSRWERGESLPDTENLIALANLYEVTLDELVRPEAGAQEDAPAEAIDSTDTEQSVASEAPAAPETASLDAAVDGTPSEVRPAAEVASLPVADSKQVVPAMPTPDPATTIPPSFDDEPVPAGPGFAVALAVFFLVTVLCGVGAFFGIWNPSWLILLAVPLYIWQHERHPRMPASQVLLRALGMAVGACAIAFALVLVSSFMLMFQHTTQTPPTIEVGGPDGASSQTQFFDPEDVHSISIDWAAGRIEILGVADIDSVSVTEVYPNDESQSFPMVVANGKNGALSIAYSEDGMQIPPSTATSGKELLVQVPIELAGHLDDLTIRTAGAQASVSHLACGRLKLDAANNDAYIDDVTADELDLSMATGSVTASGTFANRVVVSMASGFVKVTSSKTPRTASLESASGDIQLMLPKDAGFRAEVSTSSGKFVTDFEAQRNGDTYLVGDGTAFFRVGTASGSVTIGTL